MGFRTDLTYRPPEMLLTVDFSAINQRAPASLVLAATAPAPKRVMTLHLLHVLPDFGIGGVALRTVRIMNHLGPKCRHTVISLDGRTEAAERINDGIALELRAVQVDKRRVIGNLLAFRRCLVDLAPDVIATYNWGAIEWAMVNRTWGARRHIHVESGFGLDEAAGQLWRRVIARRFALATAHSVIVPSQMLERIAMDVWRLPRHQVRYIPDGIDVERFALKRYAPPEAERAPQTIMIGTVAPLRPEKNIGRLIEAFSRIADDPRFQLIIAGDGAERSRLETLAANRGLGQRIKFLGHVSRPEELLPSFDIFALSSDTEQIPNSVLEAMAVGLPIAAVDVGDVAMMVAPQNRPYIVPRAPLEALTEALRCLAADASLRQQVGAENREKVAREFAQERMFRAYEELLLNDL